MSRPDLNFPTSPSATSAPDLSGMVRLDHLGLIRAQGEDAAAFLHGQLTQDFALLGLNQARLAAYCSAKGRMLASFVGFKRATDDILLICSRDLLAPTLKRLNMFVLRAKVKLSDASDAFTLYGAVGTALPAAVLELPRWGRCDGDEGHWVRWADAGSTALGLLCQPAEDPAPQAPALPLAVWRWLEVHSSVAMISAPVADTFVPQMLNYESVEGVNFKKGCYPGQEVVARSQFRGTLKRRGYLLHSADPLQAGQEIFHATDSEQPCGTVAASAPCPAGGYDAVVSMQVAAADGQALTLGGAQGPELTLLPLPYPLLEDI